MVDIDDTGTLDLHEFLNFMFILNETLDGIVENPLAKRKLGSLELSIHIEELHDDYQILVGIRRGVNLKSSSKHDVKIVLQPPIPGSSAPTEQKTKLLPSENPAWNEVHSWMVPKIAGLPKQEQLKIYTVDLSVWKKAFFRGEKFAGGMHFTLPEALEDVQGLYLLLGRGQSLKQNKKDLYSATPRPSMSVAHQ